MRWILAIRAHACVVRKVNHRRRYMWLDRYTSAFLHLDYPALEVTREHRDALLLRGDLAKGDARRFAVADGRRFGGIEVGPVPVALRARQERES